MNIQSALIDIRKKMLAWDHDPQATLDYAKVALAEKVPEGLTAEEYCLKVYVWALSGLEKGLKRTELLEKLQQAVGNRK